VTKNPDIYSGQNAMNDSAEDGQHLDIRASFSGWILSSGGLIKPCFAACSNNCAGIRFVLFPSQTASTGLAAAGRRYWIACGWFAAAAIGLVLPLFSILTGFFLGQLAPYLRSRLWPGSRHKSLRLAGSRPCGNLKKSSRC